MSCSVAVYYLPKTYQFMLLYKSPWKTLVFFFVFFHRQVDKYMQSS